MTFIARFGSAATAGLLFAACIAGACAGPRAESTGAGARPDPQYQAKIEQVVNAIVGREERAQEQLDALAAFASDRRRDLLLQVALYLAKSTGTEQSMAGALILDHLKFTPDEKLETVLPALGGAPAPLKRVLADLLGTVDRPDGAPADFSVYESRLRAARQSPAAHADLIGYMYEVSPDAAVRTLERAHGGAGDRHHEPGSQIALLARIVSRHTDATAPWSPEGITLARASIEKLIDDPAWWRRAYAAAVLREHRELATTTLTERLMGDSSPVVRAILAP